MEDEPINEFDEEEVRNILREALKMKLEDKRVMPRKNQLNVALSNSICEFLTCYKLLGFDFDGNPVNLTVYHNKLEKSALDSQFMDELGDIMTKKGKI